MAKKKKKEEEKVDETVEAIKEEKVYKVPPYIAIGEWYTTKRGHLCRVEKIDADGSVWVTSHYTGSLLRIWPNSNQLECFTRAEDPGTQPGTALVSNSDINGNGEHDWIYEKYPHVIPDSIYKVKDTSSSKEDMEFKKVDGKIRAKTVKKTKKAATRCRIRCTNEGCKNERDIKVQDAFQVKVCDECKAKKRRKNLDKLLAKKGKTKKKKKVKK